MKLILALSLLLPAFSFAADRAGDVTAIKTLDGKTVNCEFQSDIGKTGYRPNLPVVISKDSGLELSFAVISLVCTYSDDKGYQWGLRPLNDPITLPDLDGNPYLMNIVKNEALVINKSFNIVGLQELKNEWMQMVNLPLPLEKIMTPGERRQLESGVAVPVSVEYFNRYVVTYNRNGQVISGGQFAGGAFAFSFDVTRDESGALKASAIKQ